MRYVVDIETTSLCDLGTCGAWVYAEHPSTRLLCIAWCDADSDGAPQSWDVLTGTLEELDRVYARLLCADTLIAHNANFERHCLRNLARREFGDARLWKCSAMLAGACGRPRSLKDACKSLCFPSNKQKDARGTRLLATFSYKTPAGRIYAPQDKPEDFAELVEYCRQDVVAERAVWQTLEPFADRQLWEQWLVDCDIEDRGVPIDWPEADGACKLYARLQKAAEERCNELTGGVSMRSTPALRAWTASQGWPLDSFAAAAVDEALADEMMCNAHPVVAEFLRLRKAAAGTAGKKYETLLSMIAKDGCVHGIVVGRGAHTGRYVGRGFQPQNLPRGKLDKAFIPEIRRIAHNASECNVVSAETELEFWCGDGANDALASILRDCITPPSDDECLVVSDYSAIEARVLAWLAGETWVLDIFRGDGKIYERTAAAMYGKPVEAITKHERMAGKIATLALGYGGGVGALQAFASAYGVSFDDAQAEDIVASWRKSRPLTVALWRTLDEMLQTVVAGTQHKRVSVGGVCISASRVVIGGRSTVRVTLPSGRCLTYWAPLREKVNDHHEIAVETYGYSGDSRIKAAAEGASYSRVWGGKLCENVVQAVAFDLLLTALLRARKAGLRVSFHVHDEIVAVARKDEAEAVARTLADCMTLNPAWAKGLPLATEPEVMPRYRK